MESQLQRPCDGHDQQEGEKQKKSVLKKVKDKAKKIKDTIKKHGHGHHHNKDDDQEKDHQVHGAPMLESTVVRETNLEKPKDDNKALAPENKNALPETDPNKANIEAPVRLGEDDPHSPKNTPTSSNNHSTPTPTDDSGGADEDSPHNKGVSESAAEYAHKFAETVYEKVAGAGSAVISKSNLSEKLKPGDEDKALSEVITGALPHIHKPDKPPPPPRRAKVTVSKEVAERLGTDRESKREGEDAVASGEQSSGNGVVERMENAVTSWLSKSTGIQTAQDSLSNAFVNNPSSASDSDGGGGGGVEPTSGSRDEPRHQ